MDMRASFRRRSTKPLSRSTARNSALVNQFATPGLGSLMAGRFVSGAGQLLLALAGFVLVMAWFGSVFLRMYNDLAGNPPTRARGWLGEAGAGIFAISWIWALFTSLSILREAPKSDSQPPPEVPPPLRG